MFPSVQFGGRHAWRRVRERKRGRTGQHGEFKGQVQVVNGEQNKQKKKKDNTISAKEFQKKPV